MAISFSFFVSATEMDLGECHNTFFDDYDTYVKTEQVSIDHAEIKQQQLQELYDLVCFQFGYSYPAIERHLFYGKEIVACNVSPPKLFIRNSVWRI